ncbi:MAG: DUF2262 domain-containing protein [Granulosicoccus sp.]|nr:DUF2262 domain-containing protein [Granulosicoccus sp.]
MYEQVLANLKPDGRIEGVFKGEISFQGHELSISIDPDGEKQEVTFDLTKKFLTALEAYDKKARKFLLESCHRLYNDTWREPDSPVLGPDEFDHNLQLKGIDFLSTNSVDFFYSENNLFGGHSLIAQVFDGENFEYLQMYG